MQSHTDESGKEVVDASSSVASASLVTLNSVEDGGSTDHTVTDKNGVTSKLGFKAGLEVNGEYSKKKTANLGIDGGSVGGEKGFKIGGKVYGEVNGERTKNEEHTDTTTDSRYWGSKDSVEQSMSASKSSSHSQMLSSKVSDTYGYNKTYSEDQKRYLHQTVARRLNQINIHRLCPIRRKRRKRLLRRIRMRMLQRDITEWYVLEPFMSLQL